jgi:hypothetical protein
MSQPAETPQRGWTTRPGAGKGLSCSGFVVWNFAAVAAAVLLQGRTLASKIYTIRLRIPVWPCDIFKDERDTELSQASETKLCRKFHPRHTRESFPGMVSAAPKARYTAQCVW